MPPGRLSKQWCDPVADFVGQRARRAGAVVVSYQRPPAVRHQPVVGLDPHLEPQPEAGALHLERADPGADLVPEERRRAIRDVALREDESERPAAAGSVARERVAEPVDPSGLEEAQELDVVHVLHRVEVAEAHPLHRREPVSPALGAQRGRRSGIWILASALTRNQNSAPHGASTAMQMRTVVRLLAFSASSEKNSIAITSTACIPSTAQ